MPESEWQPLFDGRTTAGWTVCRGTAFPKEGWLIEDGCLRTVPGHPLHADIATTGEFENFELELEWKVAPGSNSGVFYSVAPEPRFLTAYYAGSTLAIALPLIAAFLMRRKRGAVLLILVSMVAAAASIWASSVLWAKASGPEMQILDDDRHPNGRDPLRSAGALYGRIAPQNKQLRPVGEFNQARIVARGPRVEHWLNGRRVVAYDRDWKRRAPIALQHHGGSVWYRGIRIRVMR